MCQVDEGSRPYLRPANVITIGHNNGGGWGGGQQNANGPHLRSLMGMQ